MQIRKLIPALLLLTALTSQAAEPVSAFNGKDLTGWKNPYEWGEAKVVDGEIHLVANKKFFLVYDKELADFIFEVEVKLPEGKANSGVMFRAHVEKNKVYGYQAECDGSDRRWSGGLYDEGRRGWIWPSKGGPTKEKSQAHFAKPEVRDALDRLGWNQYKITARGNKLKIEVNGVVTTEIEDDTDASGYCAIQHHGENGQVYKFRNIRVTELD